MKRLVVLALLLTALATPTAAAKHSQVVSRPGILALAQTRPTSDRLTKPYLHRTRAVPSEPSQSRHMRLASPGGPQILSGPATWYVWHPREAAAGPPLRKALGSHWRGKIVETCLLNDPTQCVSVKLSDWCACHDGRVIDLDSRSFAQLAPLSQGIVRVSVYVSGHEAHPTPHRTAPPTDVGP